MNNINEADTVDVTFTDIGLVAALISLGFSMYHVIEDDDEPIRYAFVIESSLDKMLSEFVRAYLNNSLKVNAYEYHRYLRGLNLGDYIKTSFGLIPVCPPDNSY